MRRIQSIISTIGIQTTGQGRTLIVRCESALATCANSLAALPLFVSELFNSGTSGATRYWSFVMRGMKPRLAPVRCLVVKQQQRGHDTTCHRDLG